jgi:D-alanyl-D-alanine dipeptidase
VPRRLGRRASARRTTAPPPPPASWLGLLGEYGDGARSHRREQEATAPARRQRTAVTPITSAASGVRHAIRRRPRTVRARCDAAGTEHAARRARLARNEIEPRAGPISFASRPSVRRGAARRSAAASPPAEAGRSSPNDLVELVQARPTIHLEIRYATTNNFLGTRSTTSARASCSAPRRSAGAREPRAAAARLRAAHPRCVPSLVRDEDVLGRDADRQALARRRSAQGSRHNRGRAVDLTLYELATGRPVEMPSTYDESTERAYADYPGGTTRQRWHRALLRRVMEAEGFQFNAHEWWHFDHSTWRSYAINNVPFDKIRGDAIARCS